MTIKLKAQRVSVEDGRDMKAKEDTHWEDHFWKKTFVLFLTFSLWIHGECDETNDSRIQKGFQYVIMAYNITAEKEDNHFAVKKPAHCYVFCPNTTFCKLRRMEVSSLVVALLQYLDRLELFVWQLFQATRGPEPCGFCCGEGPHVIVLHALLIVSLFNQESTRRANHLLMRWVRHNLHPLCLYTKVFLNHWDTQTFHLSIPH